MVAKANRDAIDVDRERRGGEGDVVNVNVKCEYRNVHLAVVTKDRHSVFDRACLR